MAKKRNRLCPYKNFCTSECYGENPCEFAKKFDDIKRKLDKQRAENRVLKEEINSLRVRHGHQLTEHLFGSTVFVCSECKTLVSPRWKCCPVCEVKFW